MRAKKKGAAAPTTAQTIEHRTESYRSDLLPSSNNSKSDIGELLWSLQFPVGELQQIGWGLFERLLRRHIGLGVPPKCLSEPLQSTISRQGVSG